MIYRYILPHTSIDVFVTKISKLANTRNTWYCKIIKIINDPGNTMVVNTFMTCYGGDIHSIDEPNDILKELL